MILDILPLALQQLSIGGSELARRDGQRLFFTLLKKTDAQHVASDQPQHRVAVGGSESARGKYRGKWEFDAEIDEIQNLVEAGATADKSRAADGSGIDGTGPQRGQPLRRSSNDQHGHLRRIDPQLLESDAYGDLIRTTHRAAADFFAGEISAAL